MKYKVESVQDSIFKCQDFQVKKSDMNISQKSDKAHS